MERASQGERFTISRRGRPYARLIPPEGAMPREEAA
jgi:prevent-host-death family protein